MQLVKGSRTRPLAGVNGEVCIEKRKKLWKERKKDLTRASIVRDGRVRRFKDRSGKQVPVGAMPSAEYANVRVGPYQQVVSGVGASNGLAVICDSKDVRTMVIHALIRTRYRKER